MPATEYQGSTVPLAFLGRSILSIRRNHVVAVNTNHEQELEDYELFQKHVADRFLELSSEGNKHKVLSLQWLRKLLDTFLCCEEEFKAMLIRGRISNSIAKPPFDRLITELIDRAVKSLDICNAITHGVDSISQWQKQAQIAVLALQQPLVGEGQFRRAQKALSTLVKSMNHDEKEGNEKPTERNWSFGRKTSNSTVVKDRETKHLRSLSGSVSRTWSASKQLQGMMGNLVPPRGAELTGLALPIYTMSTVLVFVMWVLVASLPCQDRVGLSMHFPVPPRQLAWAEPLITLQERIVEDWRKKDKEKKSSVSLLEELQRLEQSGHRLIELGDCYRDLDAEKRDEIGIQAAELAESCQIMEEGLVPFRKQVRQVFHQIVRSRTKVLGCIGQASRSSSTLVL